MNNIPINNIGGGYSLLNNKIKNIETNIGNLGNAIGMRGWNQLVQNGNFAQTSNWSSVSGTVTIQNNILTYSPTTFADSNAIVGNILGTIENHKYYASAQIKFNSKLPSLFVFVGSGGHQGIEKAVSDFTIGQWVDCNGLFTRGTGGDDKISIYPRPVKWTSGDSVSIKDVVIIDLTALFGEGNEPETAEEFRKMFPANYYPYQHNCMSDFLYKEIQTNFGNRFIQLLSNENNNIYNIPGIRILNNTHDLNNLLNIEDTGFYILQQNVAHAPTNWCAMISISSGNSNGAHQLVFNGDGIWRRSYTGSPLHWTDWH